MSEFLEKSPYELDDGNLIGKDPRKIPAKVWETRSGGYLVGFKAIRSKCKDCCGGSANEVRKCVSVDCALWPLRMGAMPKGYRDAVYGPDPR